MNQVNPDAVVSVATADRYIEGDKPVDSILLRYLRICRCIIRD